MNEASLNIDWDFQLAYLDCSDSYDSFMSDVTNINQFVPTKSNQPEKNHVPWKASPPTRPIQQCQEVWHADNMLAQPQKVPMGGHELNILVSCSINNAHKRSFTRKCANVWNSLPESVITTPDLHTFKKGFVWTIPDKSVEYVKNLSGK